MAQALVRNLEEEVKVKRNAVPGVAAQRRRKTWQR